MSAGAQELRRLIGEIHGRLTASQFAVLVEAADRIEALEAALATQQAMIDDYLNYTHDGDPWSEDARLMREMEIDYAATDGRLAAIRALLPAPPASAKGDG